ncbi:hypothetical protein K1T35_05120 [Pseudonocardia sp. DSM 110487]|uniref:hypothetical protein n=1 Tax=Pseudonocardia sp. DSM 110487 TaxID=2865833 RepID=UPI001C698995|nr:hypothetical protein [Pseudonocardia sp. DSM 110487]QYN36685.1 hypothetical protein K1T35_05120 [Pseudonocardia sp. DSM 110487]
MRFPPRLVLVASAIAMVAASSSAVLLMPGNTQAAAVPVPEITSPAQQQAPSAAEPAATPGPAITGAQIAALALAPARERAAALIEEESRAEAERIARRAGDDDRWDDLRDEIRDACDDGRIRGEICRSN